MVSVTAQFPSYSLHMCAGAEEHVCWYIWVDWVTLQTKALNSSYLFSDAVSILDYIAGNGRKKSEQWIGKGLVLSCFFYVHVTVHRNKFLLSFWAGPGCSILVLLKSCLQTCLTYEGCSKSIGTNQAREVSFTMDVEGTFMRMREFLPAYRYRQSPAVGRWLCTCCERSADCQLLQNDGTNWAALLH